MEYYNPYLSHYGIQGMKWGIRRSREQLARLSGKVSEAKAKRAAKKADVPTSKKSAKDMSDTELKSEISRLKLEKEYKQLLAESRPGMTKGKKFVEDVLTDSGKALATQVVKHYGAKGLNKLIGETDDKAIADAKVALAEAVGKSNEAQRARSAAKSIYEDAKSEYKRSKSEYNKVKDLDDSDPAKKQAQSNMDSAKSKVDSTKTDYDKATEANNVETSKREAAQARVDEASGPVKVIYANNKKKD